MDLEFTKFVTAISRATDFVEAEILNIAPYHEKRVAILANAIGKAAGMDEETVYALTMAGALHDCALSEYLKDEYPEGGIDPNELNMAEHCKTGERMLKNFPFYAKVEGTVLHHHDRADGRGAFGVRAEETPVYGQILHIADNVDVAFDLYEMDHEKYEQIHKWVKEQEGLAFSDECCKWFAEAVNYDLLMKLAGSGCVELLEDLIPCVRIEVPMAVMRVLSTFFAHITDYKSHFTWRHSLGIAEKAELMGRHYGYDREICDKLYIAGALHDIGKLVISNDILEKPGKLTPEEYKEIQNHALGTWDLLHDIGGMEDITRWAAFHHEKLDGSGYPFGLSAEDLGKHERLMACLDIYQALVEERPYKAGLPHEEALAILKKMGDAGQLDNEIIRDIDSCYAEHHKAMENTLRKKKKNAADTAVSCEQPMGAGSEIWRCPVCGYLYEGELPADFICPLCEQPGTIFEKTGCSA